MLYRLRAVLRQFGLRPEDFSCLLCIPPAASKLCRDRINGDGHCISAGNGIW